VHRVAALVLVDVVAHVGHLHQALPAVGETGAPAEAAAAVEEVLVQGSAEEVQVLVVALGLPVGQVEAVDAGVEAGGQVEAGVAVAAVDL